LDASPDITVDDGRMSVAVEQITERDLTEHDPGCKQARDTVIGPLDPMGGQECTDLSYRRAIGSHPKRLGDRRGMLIRLKDAVGAALVSGWNTRPWDDALSYGTGLSFRCSFPCDPPEVLGHHASLCCGQPLGDCAHRYASEVHGEDMSAGRFDTADDFGLDLQAAEESVEIRGDDYLSRASLDCLDGRAKAGSVLKIGAAGNIEFGQNLNQLHAFTGAFAADTLLLDDGGDKRVAFASPYLADSDDADRSPHLLQNIASVTLAAPIGDILSYGF
jgi:hypothetical protein